MAFLKSYLLKIKFNCQPFSIFGPKLQGSVNCPWLYISNLLGTKLLLAPVLASFSLYRRGNNPRLSFRKNLRNSEKIVNLWFTTGIIFEALLWCVGSGLRQSCKYIPAQTVGKER